MPPGRHYNAIALYHLQHNMIHHRIHNIFDKFPLFQTPKHKEEFGLRHFHFDKLHNDRCKSRNLKFGVNFQINGRNE